MRQDTEKLYGRLKQRKLNFENSSYALLSAWIEQVTGKYSVSPDGDVTSTRVPIRFREKEKCQAFLYLPTSFCDFEDVKSVLMSMPNDKFSQTLVRILENEEDNDEIAKEHLKMMHRSFAADDASRIDNDVINVDVEINEAPSCSGLTRLELRDSQNTVESIDTELAAYQSLGQKFWNQCKLTIDSN